MQDITHNLRQTRFDNQRFARLGIELMALSQLKNRTTAGLRARPERVEFFMLLLITSGSCRHTVDFVDFDVSAGSLVFAAPNQVQQWHIETQVDGWMLLMEPTIFLPTPALSVQRDLLVSLTKTLPTVVQLDAPINESFAAQIEQLQLDFRGYDDSVLANAIIQSTVVTLLLRLAHWQRETALLTGSPDADTAVFQLLLDAVEKLFKLQWRVSQYARHLGYSESTLNRACAAATGHSAKVLIDRRLALEAARLLIHTTGSTAAVSHHLGFSEPTNFVRFFSRMKGTSPARFRRDKLGVTTAP